jgi:RNA polymerase sigma-70 factor, ECF subfamily
MSDTRNQVFSRLFQEFGGALRRYVRRLVHSRETTDEIVQEAFLRTYEHAQDGRPPTALLYSIARNLARDRRRHERVVHIETVGDFATLPLALERESLEASALAEEEARLLKDAAERLPPKCRAVFTLRVFRCYSYLEIARELGISAKTVEIHMARGIRCGCSSVSRGLRLLPLTACRSGCNTRPGF